MLARTRAGRGRDLLQPSTRKEHAPARSRAPGVPSAPFASCSYLTITRCVAFGVTLSAIDCRQCEFGASFPCRLGRTVDVVMLLTFGRGRFGSVRSTSPRRRPTTSGEVCPTEPMGVVASSWPVDKRGFKAGDDITPDPAMLDTGGNPMGRVKAATGERRPATADVPSGVALVKSGNIR